LAVLQVLYPLADVLRFELKETISVPFVDENIMYQNLDRATA